jgi:hypothetical protein
MLRKFTAAIAALTLALTAFAPSVAEARDGWRGGYGGYGRHDYYRHHDRGGDAAAAGVLGLVLGLAVGAAVSQPPRPRYSSNCYNGCYAPPPPPPCGGGCGSYGPGYYQQGYAPQPYYQQGYAPPPPQQYYQQGYDDRGYDPRYDNSGLEGGSYDDRSCTRPERQWDRYANRYVTVDVPC